MAWMLGEVARVSGVSWHAPPCARKVHHASQAEAEAHRLDVLDNRGDDGQRLEAYHCPHCDGWHVGRARRTESRLARRTGPSDGESETVLTAEEERALSSPDP